MVRVAHAQPPSGTIVPGEPGVDGPQRLLRLRGFLVILAEIGGHRALPAWVGDKSEAIAILNLLDRPADDIWTTASVPEELAVRLADAAGGSITGVEIYPVTADPEEVTADTCAARIELGDRHVTARLDQGLTLAIAAGAPVRVESSVMDRLAVPVPADDPVAPFRGPAAGRRPHVPVQPPERPRFEPQNMTFADGLHRWHLDGSASGDYSAAVQDSSAILSSTAPEPSGSAALMQTVFADDFRGAPVVFRGEVRTENVAGSAGLCLRLLWRGKEPDREQERVVSAAGSRDWSREEISALVPEDADSVRFGIVLTGSGRVWLRNPELRRDDA
jgi:bifunctional DNase/RNase